MPPTRRRIHAAFAVVVWALSQLSGNAIEIKKSTWHARFAWRAEEYFDDDNVILLCRAIEANDLEEIDRLIAAGADINARGKGNMTPLLWAFPDNNVDRLRKLLEGGADPNVIVDSDFNTDMSGIRPGESVTQMCCATHFQGYFESVFSHGGDPNQKNDETHDTPIHLLIRGSARDKPAKLRRLIDLGADINANIDDKYTGGRTPVIEAVSTFGQFDLALILLEAGADYKTRRPGQKSSLVHIVVRAARRLPQMSSQQKSDYEKLQAWLEEHGQSIAEAKNDLAKWKREASK